MVSHSVPIFIGIPEKIPILLIFMFKSLTCSDAYSVFQTQWKSVTTSTGTTHPTMYRRAVVGCANICRFIDSIRCQPSFLFLPGSGNSVCAPVQCKDDSFQNYTKACCPWSLFPRWWFKDMTVSIRKKKGVNKWLKVSFHSCPVINILMECVSIMGLIISKSVLSLIGSVHHLCPPLCSLLIPTSPPTPNCYKVPTIARVPWCEASSRLILFILLFLSRIFHRDCMGISRTMSSESWQASQLW